MSFPNGLRRKTKTCRRWPSVSFASMPSGCHKSVKRASRSAPISWPPYNQSAIFLGCVGFLLQIDIQLHKLNRNHKQYTVYYISRHHMQRHLYFECQGTCLYSSYENTPNTYKDMFLTSKMKHVVKYDVYWIYCLLCPFI